MITKQTSIKGIIKDSKDNKLKNIKISLTSLGSKSEEIYTYSDNDGEFNLNVLLSVDDSGKSLERPHLEFHDNKEQYSDYSIIPFSKDGIVYEKIIIKLDKIEDKSNIENTSKINNDISKVSKKYFNKLSKSPEEALLKYIKSQVKIIIKTLIPSLLKILSQLYSKPIENINPKNIFKLDRKSCPRKEKLDSILKYRNDLVKQLNNMSKTLDILIKAAGITAGLIGVLQIAINILLLLPIPTIGFLVGPIVAFSSIAEGLKKLVNKFASISITILIALLTVKSIIFILLNLLKLLDLYLIGCDSSYELIKLSDELELIQKEMEDEESNIEKINNIRIINGFTLGIQNVESNSIGNIIRKQAIAKNSQGIIMIKGDQSFSADEQILMDELEFYIKNNNLKAQ